MDKYAKSQKKNENDLIPSRNLYLEAFEKAPDDYYTLELMQQLKVFL